MTGRSFSNSRLLDYRKCKLFSSVRSQMYIQMNNAHSRLLDYNKCKLIVGAAARWPQMTPARH